MSVHRADIIWDGRKRIVSVVAAAGPSLVGMQMLRGHMLEVSVVDGGDIRIEAL